MTRARLALNRCTNDASCRPLCTMPIDSLWMCCGKRNGSVSTAIRTRARGVCWNACCPGSRTLSMTRVRRMSTFCSTGSDVPQTRPDPRRDSRYRAFGCCDKK